MANNATIFTKYLASVAGGAIKDGGGGMEKGVEILIKLAVKATNQRNLGIFSLIFGGTVGGVLLGNSYKNKKIIENFNIYRELLYKDKITTIQEISQITKKSPEKVKKEIQKLINKELLVSVNIDERTNKVIIMQ